MTKEKHTRKGIRVITGEKRSLLIQRKICRELNLKTQNTLKHSKMNLNFIGSIPLNFGGNTIIKKQSL